MRLGLPGVLSLKKGSPLRRARKALALRLRIAAAKRKRARSKAVFIAVTGSSAKSTTVALLAHILAGHASVRRQVLFNTMPAVVSTLRKGLAGKDFVVVETGVGARGDMQPMAALLQPDVAIVTMVGIEHYSAFRSREAVAAEKGALVEQLSPGGLALLNADDDLAAAMAARTSARVVTFGRTEAADYRVLETSVGLPQRLAVTLAWRGGAMRLQTPFAGEQFWLSTAAAVAAALELGVPQETIITRVASFEGLDGRGQPFKAGGGPTFLIDCAKAPYGTLDLSFKMLADAQAPHKRVVLGHLADYPGDPRPKYARAYAAARAIADQVFFVGDNAHRSRASQADVESQRFRGFQGVRDASDAIKATAREDEVILLKGSANLHLERIALAWKYDVKCWQHACGRSGTCVSCGLFEHPFEDHKAIRLASRRQRFWNALQFWKRRRPQAEGSAAGRPQRQP